MAGILTVFAPCVLILLPVIVGSSLATDADQKADRKKPYIISFSLGISVLLFTLLLKASTVLIGIDPQVWKSISGGIVVILGLSLLFPLLWARASAKVGLENSSNNLLSRAGKKSGVFGYVLTGAALGPVFSACSPIYALILATVLPVNLALGLVYMTLYATGLSLALLVIALAGRRLTKRLNWVATPNGWFRRALAILLILVGIAVITGFDKKVQTWALEKIPFNSTSIEEKLLPKNDAASVNKVIDKKATFNVANPYSAPEIRGIDNWINSNPQTIAGLKGKVVLVDFWTYSCINCIRTQPYLNKWYDRYKKEGFEILGIHAPEFAFEKVTKNVQNAVKAAKILYPVALDNNFATWNAYNNQYWPAKYLIDKDGKVRFTHFGEGDYAETEAAIQALLREAGAHVTQKIAGDNSQSLTSETLTPETYLNYGRGERFANATEVQPDVSTNYHLISNLKPDEWSLGGSWRMGQESTLSTGNNSKVRIRFSGRELYLVMSGPSGARVGVSVDGKPLPSTNLRGSDVDANGTVSLNGARLYKLIKSNDFISAKELTLVFPSGVTINAFTFGG
ncbi:MAG: cytochrome c biogenesis protein CcdA [Candidatus Nanopelagicaceae bacterium]|nr:cytochrome c biogenesis protein CcdA [Candidatus Nanopelagicaceae bacterium]